jgi:adenine-specific DNA methylase
VANGTVKRGSVTCPCCSYTTPVAHVRKQLKEQKGGADSSQLLVVVTRAADGKEYRVPTRIDLTAVEHAVAIVDRSKIIPPVELPLMSGVFNAPIYGITRWDLLFSSRQLLAADVLGDQIRAATKAITASGTEWELALAVKALMLLARGKYLDFRSTLCRWISVGEKIGNTFGRQALGMIFDWAEGTPFGDMSGSWDRSIEYIAEFVEHETASMSPRGVAERAKAQDHPLPDDSALAVITDPPYYNAVPYADLSDFFQIWLHKELKDDFPTMFDALTVEKTSELCEMKGWDPVRYPEKDAAFYESGMECALGEGRRLCVPAGIGVVVFAHKTTTGWETLLSALINAGWIVTGSWPIDTERGGRLRAMNSAALASSVHLVCRPREANDGKLDEAAGDWREVLQELPVRIHEWMPRLAAEGVVGADAIFACLGPALEVFSRYSRVEKSNGESVTLREYLEHVWAAISTEALSLIFKDADAAGLEPDARLTAMWLWTIGGGATNGQVKKNGLTKASAGVEEETELDDEDEESSGSSGKGKTVGGFTLEFDAARKIAQGLGIHLEKSESIVEVKADKARLLPVGERTRHLFGKESSNGAPLKGRGKKKATQKNLFEELGDAEAGEAGWTDLKGPPAGSTVLDRLHQAMILFAAGRGELMKRFLVEEGVGSDARFWKLAQSLSALYPPGTDEKRWVDGVLARKKGLGL